MGQAACAGLEHEAISLVEELVHENSVAFISQGGKSVGIALIMSRGLRPSIMS